MTDPENSEVFAEFGTIEVAELPPATAAKALVVSIYNATVLFVAGITAVLVDLSPQGKVIVGLIALFLSVLGSPILTWAVPNRPVINAGIRLNS